MHAALRREEVLAGSQPVARYTTQRLMKDLGLRGISRAKGPRTTVPETSPDTRPDLVERTLTAPGPDRLRVADIIYCRTFADWPDFRRSRAHAGLIGSIVAGQGPERGPAT